MDIGKGRSRKRDERIVTTQETKFCDPETDVCSLFQNISKLCGITSQRVLSIVTAIKNLKCNILLVLYDCESRYLTFRGSTYTDSYCVLKVQTIRRTKV
jgi:hypothetical protein